MSADLLAARDALTAAQNFAELAHMASRSLDRPERLALHVGIDQITLRIADAQMILCKMGGVA